MIRPQEENIANNIQNKLKYPLLICYVFDVTVDSADVLKVWRLKEGRRLTILILFNFPNNQIMTFTHKSNQTTVIILNLSKLLI
jgi:hypothetical protein